MPNEKRILWDPDFAEVIPSFPPTYCALPCTKGQVKKLTDPNDRCCWICINCTAFQIHPENIDCIDCPLGYRPDENVTSCDEIPPKMMSLSDQWSLGVLMFALVGVIFTTGIGIIFAVHVDTPLIKASARELSFVLLGAIFVSYASSLVFLAPPTTATCAFTRFLLGMCYTSVYATILTKTNRIARIFNTDPTSPKKTKYTSPKSQLIITGMLIAPEIVILGVWLILELPDVHDIFPTRGERLRVCKGADDASYLIALVYPFMLIAMCTVFAFKTRKTPDGFNETKFIGFTAYTTCIIWIAFLPLYITATTNTIRVVTLSLSVAANGTVALGCIFVPKVYICLFRPEKNTREAVMTRKMSNASSLSQAGNTISKYFLSSSIFLLRTSIK